MQFQLAVHPGGQSFVVRYQQQAGVQFLVQFQHQSVYMICSSFIQVAGRLVTQNNMRLAHQCPGNCGTLSFTPGKFAGLVIEAFGKTYAVQDCKGALLC